MLKSYIISFSGFRIMRSKLILDSKNIIRILYIAYLMYYFFLSKFFFLSQISKRSTPTDLYHPDLH